MKSYQLQFTAAVLPSDPGNPLVNVAIVLSVKAATLEAAIKHGNTLVSDLFDGTYKGHQVELVHAAKCPNTV